MTTPNIDADFASWVQRNPPPSLEELIAKYGGSFNIPKTAWRDFDAAMEHWQELRRLRLK